ncbi:MAG TPA: cyclic nucleotide-binding domain-containing protein [Pseudolabrys sp.]|nr:cyclic nucleotide-binding domain-containing protein [Pseudolabrys sp.]
MLQSDHDTIRALPLFRDVEANNFDRLMTAADLQQVPDHLTLIREGTLPDFLLTVVDGSVEIFCTHDGHETTLDIMQPSSAFILAAVIRNDVYLSSARTLAPSQILLIPAKQIRDVFDRDPAFARAIALELSEHHRSAVRALMDKKLRTGTKRLANWILRTGAMQGNRRTIELTLEKRTLASSLGMTPENLSRSLARLSKYGVRSSGREIVIEDSFALKRFAKPNTLIDG